MNKQARPSDLDLRVYVIKGQTKVVAGEHMKQHPGVSHLAYVIKDPCFIDFSNPGKPVMETIHGIWPYIDIPRDNVAALGAMNRRVREQYLEFVELVEQEEATV